MGKVIDLTGQRFGRLLVLKRVKNDKHNKAKWACICDCGKEVVVLGNDLRQGKTTSCSCAQKDMITQSNTIHGESESRLYNIWKKIKKRTNDKADKDYKNYGGRNIRICKEWEVDFLVFKEWALSSGYNDSLTIDRKDNNKSYSPENCRWVSMKVQNRNKRNNREITYQGTTKTLVEWAEYLGINRGTLLTRLRVGWSVEKAFTTPVKQPRK